MFFKRRKKNEKCNCIPLIEKKKFGLFFFCDKKLKKYLSIEELIKLILEGELLFRISENSKHKINIEEIDNNIDFIKDKEEKLNNIKQLRNKFGNLIYNLFDDIKYKYSKFIGYSNEYNNNKYSNNFKEKIFKKIFYIFQDITLL